MERKFTVPKITFNCTIAELKSPDVKAVQAEHNAFNCTIAELKSQVGVIQQDEEPAFNCTIAELKLN